MSLSGPVAQAAAATLRRAARLSRAVAVAVAARARKWCFKSVISARLRRIQLALAHLVVLLAPERAAATARRVVIVHSAGRLLPFIRLMAADAVLVVLHQRLRAVVAVQD